jgi:hypothetical protein
MRIDNLNKECLAHIEEIAWDPNVSDLEKIHSIQGLLYSWGQSVDHVTEQLFGSDQYPLHDEQSDYPNPRRM